MKDKSIAELIHDRVFAEGGTLNVWLGGAKFRRLTTTVNSRSLHSATAEEDMSCLEEFSPSAELAQLIRRNAIELRRYFARHVGEWRAEIERTAPSAEAPARVLSAGASLESPNAKGQDIRDCHGVTRSTISEPGVKSAVSAGLLAVWSAFGGVAECPAAEMARRSEIGAYARPAPIQIGPAWGEASHFSVDCQGEGGGCLSGLTA